MLMVAFAVLVLVGAGRLAQATPEEDIARLEMQVKMLTSQMAQMSKEIEVLKAKVAEMEAAGGPAVVVRPPVVVPPVGPPRPPVVVPPIMPPVVQPPVVPVIPGAGAGAAGKYALDTDLFVESLLKMQLSQVDEHMAGMPEEEKEVARQQIRQQVQQMAGAMQMTVVLSPDGQFSMEGLFMGQKSTAEGTWKLEGEKLFITTTSEDGSPKETPEEKTGIYRDGKIYIGPDDDMPMQIVLNRQ
jgi:hypothetical protein